MTDDRVRVERTFDGRIRIQRGWECGHREIHIDVDEAEQLIDDLEDEIRGEMTEETEPEWKRWLEAKPDLSYWSVNRDMSIDPSLVPMAYEGLGVEEARKVRDELTEAIEWCENNEWDHAE